jgi:outer membrane protein OmpA-like peptidoglycan-associated protein/tetratricopeptide (TPR) repeat protein
MIKSPVVIICLSIFLLGFSISSAQAQSKAQKKSKEHFNKALRSYQMHNYEDAEKECKKAIDTDPGDQDAYSLLATIYDQEQRFDEEISLYEKYIGNHPDEAFGYYNNGIVYQNTGKYKEGIESLQKALEMKDLPGQYRNVAQKRIDAMQFGLQLMAKPVPFHPVNLGHNINTRMNEYPPAFTVDGQTMFFTRTKVLDSIPEYHTIRSQEDIMMSHLADTNWLPAIDVPGINTLLNEGAMAIAPDGSYLIFTACDRKESLGGCDLYISFFKNGVWTKPADMGEPINSRWKETQPSISYDGKTIYFSSNRPGSIGGLDIWKSTRDDNWNFSEPVNLGLSINTRGNEQTPFIHTDDQTLYFTSDGHPGMGKNDIFYARKSADGWDTAINIGYPINTTEDETGFVVDRAGEYAYYSSAKIGGYGGFDIFKFKLPEAAKPKPVTYLKGKVFDEYTKHPLEASLELVDLDSNKTVLKTSTQMDGMVLAALPSGHDYMVNVSAKGYLFYSDNIPLKNYKNTEPYQKDIPLSPIKAGEKLTLRNIFFPTDGYTLEAKSQNELGRLIQFLQDNPQVKIEVSGHTDNTGSAQHNQELSTKRAKAVYDYLIKEGKIAANRLSYKGYGSSQPVASNNTEEGKAQNRRTEVKLVQ